MTHFAAEWLEADGLGGFASGTASGVRTRRYHGLLLAQTAPAGLQRMMLVNGFDAWIDREGERIAISSQRYPNGVVHPDGVGRLMSFERAPWPTWSWSLPGGDTVHQELLVARGAPAVAIAWRLDCATDAGRDARLVARPFLSGRDMHATHHENDAFRFLPDDGGAGRLVWRPYDGVPGIVSAANAVYAHDPLWYRRFEYDVERERGLDHVEDLASPGTLTWSLAEGEAVWILAAELSETPSWLADALSESPSAALRAMRDRERRRRGVEQTSLQLAAEDYIVSLGRGKTIVAGYPWFSDWGRDTFISMRGLCLDSGAQRLRDARDVLLGWAGHVSQGMLPNYFPEGDRPPEYNSVDASLWFVIAVHDLLHASAASGALSPSERSVLHDAVEAIVAGYAAGTRYGIRADHDGLLAAGEAGVQLTWMDARADGREVTPRIGKPVEVQALWINALMCAGERQPRWTSLAARAAESFAERFWCERGYLYDVVDVDHQAGSADASFRPNQLFAVGGLPHALLVGARARQVVDAVEARLWTPAGVRTLAPDDARFASCYSGPSSERDACYHQGTAWPWLVGAFVDAWLRVRGGGKQARRDARTRFLDPLVHHYRDAGLGHIAEIADGDPPHAARGCPFQAWSVGEMLRAYALAVGDRPASPR